jgi:hypothetical protein
LPKYFYVHDANFQTRGKKLTPQHTTKRFHATLILYTLIIFTIIIALSGTPQVNAQSTPTLLVTGADGTSINYTLTQLKAMPATSGWGGFYQTIQSQSNNGFWTGVALLYLCNQVGGITQYSNITVTGQGINNFTYNMVNSGTDFNPTYTTYNNLTGTLQNQNLPITVILAYQVNGTNIDSNQVPRMVIVGSEGLLMDGSGGRSVTKVNVTNYVPTATPIPTPTPTPTPTTPYPTPTATPTKSPKPSPSPSPTPSPSQSPTTSPSPTPASTTPIETNNTQVLLEVGIAVAAIVIIAVVVVVILKRK